MIYPKYDWQILTEGLVSDKDIFKHILRNRQIDDLYEFFHRGKDALHDASLLGDILQAKTRILQAIAANERIVIYGDYDCDGITSVSVLMRALSKLHANVTYDLPDRFQDGYGLNMKAAQEMIHARVSLVITVDNGITCVEEVKLLQQAGIDVIITDHHEPKKDIPEAYAIIHPKLSPNYPFKELAGVGVAYKLASYLLEEDLDELYDLVMIGTIADMMPLVDENQALVNLGMFALRNTLNLGLKKIIQHSHLDYINETAVAFKIAPKINSSGRLNKAKDAVQLLITTSESEASRLILEIEQNHIQRKDLTDDAYLLCESLLNEEDQVIVVASEELHEGIIGICAQKLVEKYQKTTCVIYIDEQGLGKGSMRAFGDDNALELLSKNEDILSRFGGHGQAAGLQIQKEHIPLLQKRLNQSSKGSLKPLLKVDMEVKLSEVHIKTILELESYSFFTAKFAIRQLTVKGKQKMSDKHTKLLVSDGLKQYDAVMFNSTEYFYLVNIGDQIDLVGGLSVNTWKNVQRLQIMIKDLACYHQQFYDFRNPQLYFEASNEISMDRYGQIINDEVLLEFNSLVPTLESENAWWITPSQMILDLHKYTSRAGLLELYRLIQNQKSIPLQNLQNRLHLHPTLFRTLLSIFEELGLVRVEDDTIHYQVTYLKQDLELSRNYQTLLKKKAMIAELYSMESSSIPLWFTKYLEV